MGHSAKKQGSAAVKILGGIKGLAVFLLLLSGVINILALTGSFYMLQIYDRALVSGSIPTLAAISVLAIGLYMFQGVFDIIRTQILVRVGARLDRRLAPVAHQLVVDMPRLGYSTSEALERGRDVDTLRTFCGSQGPIAIFDLPWMPIFLAFVYFLHPTLGALTIAGAFTLTTLAIITEWRTRNWSSATMASTIERNAIADSNARNAEVLKAMGFASRAVARFTALNDKHLELQTRTSDISGTYSAISRVLRMLLQSAILGLAAYLTIIGQLSAGAIIAATIASARAMAPIDMAIGNAKNMEAARAAWKRLRNTVEVMENQPRPMRLPAPKSFLSVEGMTISAPATGRVLLSDITFRAQAGQAVGIIGPSGGGKTTLARALTGIWPTLRGAVRMDGAEMRQWADDARGVHIGYMPQDVALLDATVEENIARLAEDPNPEDIVEAARAAMVHEMIVRLPDGYRTHLGPMGTSVSGGQRQRLGLARALYGNPFLVVLDEPNAHLDPEGEAALTAAIEGVKSRGGIVVLIAHRPSALQSCDLIGVIQDGKLTAFGPREEILNPRRLADAKAQPKAAPANNVAVNSAAPEAGATAKSGAKRSVAQGGRP
ncbi:type I secretion system permease/ATPase [Roseovarius nanhaiticus]|uniref:ATP-binding cassette, subfamily C n=1 Tax=Roseovarius nanhaiticus TaxID=573024 RepID=A0A1N7HM56_9RHOB|nr:type I secretion system permease/ATPase [Roseovarius nanhaiticus]SEL28776.1 ATP-binding cassette, subfamily C [Roseovarius nanhaiticus]SIS25778.1 ATP-binding cassette, subfamily C [Roseovarius nanhaiticus]